MGNRFIIFLVFAAVVQGGFTSSAVKGTEASPDIEIAHKKMNEELTQAVEVIFGSIEGNTSSDDAKNGYLGHLLKGYDYYFAVQPSYSHDDGLQRQFESSFKTFMDTLFKAVDFAKSKDGNYSDIVTQIKAIHAAIDAEPVVEDLFNLIGSSSVDLWTKITANLDTMYRNIFSAMISRAALNFGMIDEIPSSFKDGAIAGVLAISESLYDPLQNNS